MRFRMFIFKDPDARDRGYSLAGIKIPLTCFCPVPSMPNILSYDDASAHGPYAEYWPVPVSLLVMARPNLRNHLRDIATLLVPTDWVSIDPIDGWD